MGAREPKLDSQQFELISKALADPKRFEMLQRIAASYDLLAVRALARLDSIPDATQR